MFSKQNTLYLGLVQIKLHTALSHFLSTFEKVREKRWKLLQSSVNVWQETNYVDSNAWPTHGIELNFARNFQAFWTTRCFNTKLWQPYLLESYYTILWNLTSTKILTAALFDIIMILYNYFKDNISDNYLFTIFTRLQTFFGLRGQPCFSWPRRGQSWPKSRCTVP